jgi:hypothetical protein
MQIHSVPTLYIGKSGLRQTPPPLYKRLNAFSGNGDIKSRRSVWLDLVPQLTEFWILSD